MLQGYFHVFAALMTNEKPSPSMKAEERLLSVTLLSVICARDLPLYCASRSVITPAMKIVSCTCILSQAWNKWGDDPCLHAIKARNQSSGCPVFMAGRMMTCIQDRSNCRKLESLSSLSVPLDPIRSEVVC